MSGLCAAMSGRRGVQQGAATLRQLAIGTASCALKILKIKFVSLHFGSAGCSLLMYYSIELGSYVVLCEPSVLPN